MNGCRVDDLAEGPKLLPFAAGRDQRAGGFASGRSRRAATKAGVAPLRSLACHDQDYSPAEVEFLSAVASYRARNGRKFLSAVEFFRIAMSLSRRRPAVAEAVA